ncbi:MAG TPA: Ig-like domain-containing protein, partial [Mycobacterium sp.]|nr:Ig-like domain-containing protein [Mycobacterium sp.]
APSVTPAAAPASLFAPVFNLISDVVNFALSPFANLNTNPNAPQQDTPFVWTLLAFVRREIVHTFFNQTPTVNPTQTSEDATGVVTGNLNAVDPDGDPLTFTVTQNPSNGTVVVNTDGSYTYTPTPGFAHTGGSDAFTVTVDDSAGTQLPGPLGIVQGILHAGAQLIGLSGSDTVTTVVPVSVIAINQNPIANPDSYTTDENTALTVGAALGVLANDTDPDGDTLAVNSSTQPAGGTLTMNSDGSFLYTPATDFTGNDSFTYTATDGHGGTSTSTVQIDVVATGPTITTTSGADSYTEQAPAITVDNGVTVGGVPALGLASVSISKGFDNGDTLAVTAQVPNAVTVSYNPTTGVLSLVGIDNTTDYQALLRSVTFSSTSDNPTTSKTITFTVSDGPQSGASATKTITVTPVNDAPVLSSTGGDITAVERTATPIDPTITISDPDDTTLAGATVKITKGLQSGEDTLNFTDQNGITGSYDSAKGVLSLTGNASINDYQTALESITYTDTSHAPATNTRTITIHVDDGHATHSQSNAITHQITVTPVYDASVTAHIADMHAPKAMAVSSDGKFLYVANSTIMQVSVIDTSTNTVTATIPLTDHPNGLALSPDGTRLYIASGQSFTTVDTADNSVLSTIPNGDNLSAVAVSPDGSRAYVTNLNQNSVSVIDTSGPSVVAAVSTTVSDSPEGIAVSPDGTQVFVTDPAANTVVLIDTATDATTSFGVGSHPSGVAFTPDGSRAFVTNYNGATVSVIDTSTDTVTTTVTVGTGPAGIAMSRDGKYAYVTNAADDTVSVIDTASDSVIATVHVGAAPDGVTVSPDGSHVYVANGNSDSVSVITVN